MNICLPKSTIKFMTTGGKSLQRHHCMDFINTKSFTKQVKDFGAKKQCKIRIAKVLELVDINLMVNFGLASKLLFFSIFFVILCDGAIAFAGIFTKGEPQIIERVIKIEGEVEKPRVLFIVPRAKLWRDDIPKKTFIPEILKPVQPDLLMKEFISANQLRR